MHPPCTSRVTLAFLIPLLTLLLAACGGGGGNDEVQRALDDLMVAEIAAEQAAEAERLLLEEERRQLDAAIAENQRGLQEALQRVQDRQNNQPRAQPHEYEQTETPEQQAGREREEAEAERARLEAEAEAERRRQEVIAENEEYLREIEARGKIRARLGAYRPWGYHDVPSFELFDAWQDTLPSAQIALLGGEAKAGVVLHNGQHVPWMRGNVSGGSLYSSDLRFEIDEYGYREYTWSDARWKGSLVGFTPQGQSVTGAATLSDFDFSHPDPGTAMLSFTGLAYADGATWGDGSLQYQVGVGKTFGGYGHILDSSFSHPFRKFDCTRHVNGCNRDSISIAAGVRDKGYRTNDAGEVRGLFFGTEHEAMAGTLLRDDLTAAFGGER